MERTNTVYIAKSLDGYIADKNGGLDWLSVIPNPENNDMGFVKFLSRIDAIVMGRNTFETVCGFEGDWPYPKPVFVMSNTLTSVPEKLQDKVRLVKGTPAEIINKLNEEGFVKLYIDGGKTIQSFLKEDLIDELIIATIPILIGAGIPLFGELPKELEFEHIESVVHLNAITQDSYRRKR